MSWLTDFFRPLKKAQMARWREIGSYMATFAPFGPDIWGSDLVRSAVRALAAHTSKAHAVCTDPEITKLLNIKPNMYMTGADMLSKLRIWLEVKNTAFIYISRNENNGKVTGFYPVPYASYEALEYGGELYLRFFFNGAERQMVLPWADLVPLRKDYYTSDIWGDANTAILQKLEIINTEDQGMMNAVKATANLRGILKNTKSMLSREDIKKAKEEFVTDYLNLENSGGIASIDATQEFTPITMSPIVADPTLVKQHREDVYRYFGVNDAVLMNDYNEDQLEAFYAGAIEPFLVMLGTALTDKLFTRRELALGSSVIYESNRLRYASNKTKLNLVQLVDRGCMSPNEMRQVFNLAPYDGGDTFVRRLDTAKIDDKEGESKKDE